MTTLRSSVVLLVSLALAASCAVRAPAARGPQPQVQEGLASWYGKRHHGRPTASGEPFDKEAMTAAHRRLRMGTFVRVSHLRNGRSVVVRINDRGPFGNRRRIIDLSEAAARALRMIDEGVAPVRVEVIHAKGARMDNSFEHRRRGERITFAGWASGRP